MIRKSIRPSKQLLWFFFSRDAKLSNKFKIGLDIACGDMSNRNKFKTSKYIGIDLDEQRIKQGLNNYPDVEFYITSIEDMSNNIKGDFVVCLQTIGINNKFHIENTIKCIQKLVDSVNSNGMLIFNMGTESVTQFSNDVETILSDNFLNFKKIEYGNFSEETHLYKSLIIASLMFVLPKLRQRNKKYQYFVCYTKK